MDCPEGGLTVLAVVQVALEGTGFLQARSPGAAAVADAVVAAADAVVVAG